MCNQDNNSSNSGFIFGIFLGAIIGALVAIYFYKNNKADVFEDLKIKLEKYFKQFTTSTKTNKTSSSKPSPKTPKISVTIPKTVESIDLQPVKKSPPRKMFKK